MFRVVSLAVEVGRDHLPETQYEQITAELHCLDTSSLIMLPVCRELCIHSLQNEI